MPTIFVYDGFQFFFYSNEGAPREPMHVHVTKAGCEVTFWLRPVRWLQRTGALMPGRSIVLRVSSRPPANDRRGME